MSPNTKAEIEDEAIHQKFLHILKLNGITDEVSKITFSEPGELKGEHMATVSLYVIVEFKNPLVMPMNFFVKTFVKNNPGHNAMMKEMKVMEKEASFFMEFLPYAKEYLKNYKGCENLIDCFPKCFYGDEEMIVLENLVVDDSFVMLPFKELQDLHTAKLVLENLAKFHAVTHSILYEMGVHSFRQKFELVALEVMFPKDNLNPVIKKLYDNVIATSILIMKKHAGESTEKGIKTLTDYIGKTEEMIRKACEFENEDNKFQAINHGDCWTNNMLFKVDSEGGKAVEHVFVDLQITRVASPSLDIGYYLFTSVRPEIRRAHFPELIKHYYESFEKTLELLNKKNPITFEEFVEDLKKKCAIGFLTGLNIISAKSGALKEVEMENQNGEELDLAEILNNTILNWIEKNPSKSKEISDEIVATINEFIDFTSS